MMSDDSFYDFGEYTIDGVENTANAYINVESSDESILDITEIIHAPSEYAQLVGKTIRNSTV